MDSSKGHLIRYAAGLTLAVGLLSSCGSGADGDGGYGAPPPTTAGPTTDRATDDATEDTTDDATDDDAVAAPLVVVISGFSYEVPDTVAPGTQITVRNEDNVGHTVTSDDDGATFDVTVPAGGEATFTAPEEPGDYDFFCRPHPNMTATLVVEEA